MTVTALGLVLAVVIADTFSEVVCGSPEELGAILSGGYRCLGEVSRPDRR